MATRFYFPLDEAAPVTPPDPGAEWEHFNNVHRKLLATPDSSTLTTVDYSPDAADDLTNRDSLHRTYVSDSMVEGTLIEGTVKAQLQCLETAANNNLFLTLKIMVLTEDGSTVQVTPLAITRDTTTELATSLTNRNFPSTSLSGSYETSAGDKLCVEIGLGGNITSGTGGTIGHNGSIRWGCNASSGDLGENDSETGTTWRGWIEFSGDITFEGSGAISGSITGTATLTGALTGSGALSTGSQTGTATVAATLTGSGALVGSELVGTATISGTITSLPSEISGSLTGGSELTGDLTGSGALVGTGTGTATISGTLTGTGVLIGSELIGTATISGTLTNEAGPISGSITGTSVLTGSLLGEPMGITTCGSWSVPVTINECDEWRVVVSGPSADAPRIRISMRFS